METQLKLLDRILKFLSKVKCKIVCCCRSSCAMEQEQQLPENIKLESISDL